MTEYQYLRTEMPDPKRWVVARPDGVTVHYFHTETREYLGSEVVAGTRCTPFTAPNPPACTVTVCPCRQCTTPPREDRPHE